MWKLWEQNEIDELINQRCTTQVFVFRLTRVFVCLIYIFSCINSRMIWKGCGKKSSLDLFWGPIKHLPGGLRKRKLKEHRFARYIAGLDLWLVAYEYTARVLVTVQHFFQYLYLELFKSYSLFTEWFTVNIIRKQSMQYFSNIYLIFLFVFISVILNSLINYM